MTICQNYHASLWESEPQLEDVSIFTENQRLRRVTLRENVWYHYVRWFGRTNGFFFFVYSAKFNVCLLFNFSLIFRFWSDNDIYFFYCCSNVVEVDAVADVAVAMGPEFVACYCHLPRSSYKHGASLKAPYPLRISQFFV